MRPVDVFSLCALLFLPAVSHGLSADAQPSVPLPFSIHQAREIALTREPGRVRSQGLAKDGRPVYTFLISCHHKLYVVEVDGKNGEVVRDSLAAQAKSHEGKSD